MDPIFARFMAARKSRTFWGLGLEHECYLEVSPPVRVEDQWLMDPGRWQAERYSVDYFANYRCREAFGSFLRRHLLATVAERGPFTLLPRLMNAYALVHMDVLGHHRHVTGSKSVPNPDFVGPLTIWQDMCARDPYFTRQYKTSFVFDGDTVEFMTRDFCGATVARVLAEWDSIRSAFAAHLAGWYAEIRPKPEWALGLCESNHGLATQFSTSFQKLSVFNNMTMHVNVTLPTELDPETGLIADEAAFVHNHRRLACVVQWLEPLWIAMYGAGDCLAVVPGVRMGPGEGNSFNILSRASQRGAVSRYIGVGTYDTRLMPTGKIMTVPWRELEISTHPFWWYHRFYERCGYARLDLVGLDLNFRKHTNHGLEIRFWDAMERPALRRVLDVIVSVGDLVLSMPGGLNAHGRHGRAADSPVWNEVAGLAMEGGRHAQIGPELAAAYTEGLGALLGLLDWNFKAGEESKSIFARKETSVAELYEYLVDGLHAGAEALSVRECFSKMRGADHLIMAGRPRPAGDFKKK